MTDWFEILDRDGPARIGRLRLTDPLATPACADDVIHDAGSLWAADRETPPPSEDVVTMVPHRGIPAGTPGEVADAFATRASSIAGPSGTVIDGRSAADHDVDVYALSSVQGIRNHAAAFREAVIRARRGIPDDTALYLSGIATPTNVPLLAYAGVDLVDTDRARLAATRGRYLLSDGWAPLEDLDELPCACPACRDGLESFDREDLAAHNVASLEAELAMVRTRIRSGRLRTYVSARCRHVPWLTAGIRELDAEAAYVDERTPLFRSSTLSATTDDDLDRPAVRRYARRIDERYVNRFDGPLVLLPCSARKPYSESRSHRRFRDAIGYRAHMVSLSSPIGVVPQELECTYPAQHYDVPVTGRWTATERDRIGDQLAAYVERHDYPRVIAHVAPGPYRDLVERATEGVEVTYTVEDHPTTGSDLATLEATLDGTSPYTRETRRRNTVRAIADYQFGSGAGTALFPDVEVEAPYPKHRVLDASGTHLATMVPNYGLLALTIAGARRWRSSDVSHRTVEIDAFVPHGDVLAPGIIDADEAIRVGDEVVVTGPRAFAIGRATMHGRAMVESSRGVAVDVRHTEEIDT